MKTKTKKPTRSKLIKQLDHYFSQYIRLKYANPKWFVQCFTCGDIHHWKEIQNGHFVSRWNYKYRRDETNCFPQNIKCNIFLHWNYPTYTLKMIDMFGREKVEEMLSDKQLVKISTPEIEDMIQMYKIKVEELLKHIEIKQ